MRKDELQNNGGPYALLLQSGAEPPVETHGVVGPLHVVTRRHVEDECTPPMATPLVSQAHPTPMKTTRSVGENVTAGQPTSQSSRASGSSHAS